MSRPTKRNTFNSDEFALILSERLKESVRAPNIKKYTPHQKQFEFHSSMKKKKLYIGGNRSGKTTGGVVEDIWRATCTHPYRQDLNEIGPNRGRVIAVDFVNGVEKIIFPQFKQWLYPSAMRGGSWEDAYDKITRTLHFSNGSFIEFMSYDQDVDKFAGTSRHWIHFDEEPPYPIYAENMARLIDTNGDFWITMTPLEGMNWIYDKLYENNVNNPDGDVFVITINTLENPFLNTSAIEDFLNSVDEDQVEARIKGDFIQQGGLIYKEFDKTVGGRHILSSPILDPKNELPQQDWTWVMALDHGLNNPTAVLWIAVHCNGFMVVFDEHYRSDWTIEQHAAQIKLKIKEHGRFPDLMVADPSIGNRNAITGTSIHTEYAKNGLGFMMGNNDVKAGIIRVKRYMKPFPFIGELPDHPMFSSDHVLKSGEIGFNKVNFFSGIRLSPRCEKTIWEMKRYRWKTYSNKKLIYENNSFEEPHKKDDHAMDTLRYAIMSQPEAFSLSANSPVGSKMEGINTALSNLGLDEDISVQGSIERGFADPNDIKTKGWTIENGQHSPAHGQGWSFDEHMGMEY